jgi:hypothetical protein
MIIKYNVTLLLLIFFCRFSFADTYIWEDYDDFSGSTLDTSKWEVGFFSGGQDPVVVNGRVELKGGPYSGTDVTKLPQDLLPISQNSNEGNVFLFIKKDGIQGMEVDITLPSLGNSPGASIGIDVFASNPFSSYGIELGEDESPNWGGVYFYYDYLNPAGNEMEGAKVADWDTTYRVGYLRTEGKTTLLIDGQTVQQFDQSFTSNYWSLNVFNEAGSSFVAYADNVRVLRRSTTTPLDGSTLVLSSTVGVSETLAFENGTFTSTFVDPQEGTIVKAGQSYTLDQITQDAWKITLEDGDTYSFDYSKGTGISEDFTTGNFSGDNSFELISGNLYKDLHGSGAFTFKHYEWEDYDDFSASSLDTNKWEVGYFAGGEAVTVFNGQAKLSGSTYSFSSPFQIPSELSAAGQGSTEGNTFLFIKDPTIIGLEADIMIPNAGNQNEVGIYLTTLDSKPLESLGFELRKTATGSSFNYDYFNDQGSKTLGYEAGSLDTFHKIKMTELNGQTSYYLDNKLIKQFASTSHDSDYWGIGAFNDNGLAYTTYADNVRILRQGTTITQPEPVTVVSGPNGQAIVVQVGDEYQWKSTLDGITLWMVHEDDDDGWFGATVQYVSGIQKGSIGLTDQLGSSLEVNHPYIVDENGMIKVTEDTAFQYYQVTSVENGVIITADDSSFPLSDTSRFFTTRAAAEEYYYSKVGYPNPNGWLWFDHYPWVYSHKEQGWLYFKPSGGKLMYFSHKNKIWREFSQ